MDWVDGDDDRAAADERGSVWPLVVYVVAADVLAILGTWWPCLS